MLCCSSNLKWKDSACATVAAVSLGSCRSKCVEFGRFPAGGMRSTCTLGYHAGAKGPSNTLVKQGAGVKAKGPAGAVFRGRLCVCERVGVSECHLRCPPKAFQRSTDRRTDGRTDRQADGQTNKTDRQTHTHTHTHTHRCPTYPL